MSTIAQDEREIRSLLESWAEAVRAGDLMSVVAHHTDDILMFDVPPPVLRRGRDAYEKSWPEFFRWRREHNGVFDIVSLDVCTGSDVAFATAVLCCASEARRRQDDEPRLRLTVGLKKSAGQWLIAHEHHSFPQGDAD